MHGKQQCARVAAEKVDRYSILTLTLPCRPSATPHCPRNSYPENNISGLIMRPLTPCACSLQLIARYYMKFTGMTADQIERATNRDTFMTPEDAKLVGVMLVMPCHVGHAMPCHVSSCPVMPCQLELYYEHLAVLCVRTCMLSFDAPLVGGRERGVEGTVALGVTACHGGCTRG